jgi:hypothetical protein
MNGRAKGAHRAAVQELAAAVRSEAVQRFLAGLRGMTAPERDAILDVVLTGAEAGRVDLGLPPGIQVSRRRFRSGPPADLAFSTRVATTGALVTIFVSVCPPPAHEPAIHAVLPWDPARN